jgi:hypothetical protein
MAHPTANGFLGSRFPAGGIPAAYTLIANKFYDLVENNQVSKGVTTACPINLFYGLY